MASLLLALPILALTLPLLCQATYHVVGDGAGWSLGVDYDNWASSKNFVAGDTLTFNYGRSHKVVEVTKSDYDRCDVGHAIASHTGGTTTITLRKPATTYYYICSTPFHCPSGMKVAVTTAGTGGGGGGSNTNPPTSPGSQSAAVANDPRLMVTALLSLGLGLGLSLSFLM